MLVTINGIDITKYITTASYEVNSENIYEEWQDADYVTHREIIREKVSGEFELKFPSDGGHAYAEFIELLKQNTASGKIPITVFVNNRNEYRTFNAYYEFAPTMRRNYMNRKVYENADFELEEC